MLATGLLALYQLTSEGAWLTAATGLLDTAVAHFGDPQRPGRWFDTADDAERLMLRPSDPLDGATPSGASSIAEALLTAGHVVDGARAERYWQLAADTLRAHAVLLARAPRSAGIGWRSPRRWCADRCRSPSRATCRGRPCWRLARTVFQALRTVHQPSSEHTQPAAACHRSYCSSHLGEPPRLTDMTQKTRIQPLPPKRAGLLIRALYRIAKRRFGEVPEPFTVTAHHRRLLIANVVHEALLQRASRKLPPSVRELAVFWTARSIGCSWCVDFGAMLQRLDGLDVDRLTDIDNYATSSKFSDDERAAIAYAEAMTADPHSVTDEQVADLRARFGEAGVIELTYQIGVENMRARMNSALGITEQGFNSGDACRVPWAAPDVPSAESR